jgi:hypothetical protein
VVGQPPRPTGKCRARDRTGLSRLQSPGASAAPLLPFPEFGLKCWRRRNWEGVTKGLLPRPLAAGRVATGGGVLFQEVQSTSTSGSGPSGGAPRSTPVTSLTWPRSLSSPGSSARSAATQCARTARSSPGCRSASATTPKQPLARCRPPGGGPSARTEPRPRPLDQRCRDPRSDAGGTAALRALARRTKTERRLGARVSMALLDRLDADHAAALDIDPNSVSDTRPADLHTAAEETRPHVPAFAAFRHRTRQPLSDNVLTLGTRLRRAERAHASHNVHRRHPPQASPWPWGHTHTRRGARETVAGGGESSCLSGGIEL